MYTTVFLRSLSAWALTGAALFGMSAPPAWATSSFTLFESGQVRPLALSPDGKRLYAVNTPDNRLEIFRIGKHGLRHRGSVPVGLEPVAVAVRAGGEVWVVNHLSDSVSIVRADTRRSQRVVRTLLVGDEPRDIVFAGPGHGRAFITTAHRGQNAGTRGRGTDPDSELTTPGVGRADVWVFDAERLGTSLGGDPLTVLTLFTDTPRALAATPDGATVYAAGFHTGNRTTAVNEFLVKKAILTAPDPCTGLARSYPGPLTNHAGILQPEVGLIVKFDGLHWRDERGQLGPCWDDQIPFSLPDTDVFTIDALANPPIAVGNGAFSGVGTVLFNMIVNPVSGRVYVANTEAQNQVRFEGAGALLQDLDPKRRSVQGHLHESHITVLGPDGSVSPRHLNKHIDFSQCCAAIPNEENATSVAFPQSMAITGDGSTLYVPMLGTSEVAVYDTQKLENDTFVPDKGDQIPVKGGGPSGVVLNEAQGLLYVLTRFDNSLSIIDTETRTEIKHLAMFNPEPRHIVKGRPFLYDASFTSSHGDSACASCHVFGDFDSLAWDLGDPDQGQTDNTGPFRVDQGIGFFLLRAINLQTGELLPNPVNPHFRPMKGPMTTQSLRGLDNHGSMHWRGDRTGGNDANFPPISAGENVQPNGGSFNENLAFLKFNVAFLGLNGRDALLSDKDMQQFTDFALDITYPPNPIRNLDKSLTPEQQAGRDFYFNSRPSDTFFECNGCHVLDPGGNPEVKHPGFFGTDGQFSFEGESQFFKIPHLRNLYQKVGMFGMAPPPRAPFVTPEQADRIAPLGSLVMLPFANNGFLGPQVRGFGFLHDGSVDTVFRFISSVVFTPRPPGTLPILDPRTPPELLDHGQDPGNAGGLPIPPNDPITPRRNLESFLLAFDSNLAPVVGQQVTLSRDTLAAAGARVDLLIARAEEKECDLVARDRLGGYLYLRNGKFKPSYRGAPPVPDRLLRARALLPKGELTYTCVPPGSGRRIGLDRDADGILDGNDRG